MPLLNRVCNGLTSWLFRRASASWQPVLVQVDPSRRKGSWTDAMNNSRTIDMRGGRFQDVARVDWQQLGVEPARALVLLDDHQDQLERLQQMRQLGFRHLVFDDNHPPGLGDIFSIKNACDGGHGGHRAGRLTAPPCGEGELRDFFGSQRRCTGFHSKCATLTRAEFGAQRDALVEASSVIWEAPPLAPIDSGGAQPITTTVHYAASRAYEGPGPGEWTSAHTAAVLHSTKAPSLQLSTFANV